MKQLIKISTLLEHTYPEKSYPSYDWQEVKELGMLLGFIIFVLVLFL